ncbi:unnamed protein product [Phytophthora lilii]|uniref:Unnamed protein product n=1 Tax=Phytophthora lilii TaxID=2077276 RepID=A0A9W6XD50_9STRA|nr:unnamed protein product [Phytophthora lilii]
MDLSEIPFGVPVILQSLFKRKNLQNPLGSTKARCLEDNRDIYEQLILHRVRDDKIAIQSVRNGRYLQVRTSGECVFDPKKAGEWELFSMETDDNGALFFVSCHTGNVLQCDGNCTAKCSNENRQLWESWRILGPHSTAAPVNQIQLAQDQRALAGRERRHFILELVKYGKSADEIEQIVSRLFDAPAALPPTSTSAFAVPVDKA